MYSNELAQKQMNNIHVDLSNVYKKNKKKFKSFV